MSDNSAVNELESPLFDQTPGKGRKKPLRKPILNVLDTTISIVIVSPLVVLFWRSVNELFSLYYNVPIPQWLSFGLSTIPQFLFIIIQDKLEKIFADKKRKLMDFIIFRLYIYLFAISNILFWTICWKAIDWYFGVKLNEYDTVSENNPEIMTMALVSLLLLIVFKCVINITSPPFLLCLDRKDGIFKVTTRYKRKMTERPSLYILDCLFSVLIIGTLVVFVWRGAWTLVDIYLFPEDHILSSWASLAVGYAAVAITFLMQPPMRWICDRITGTARLIVADIFVIFSLIGTVNVWRGIWNLLNIYFMPGSKTIQVLFYTIMYILDNRELGCWITHWISLVVLICLGCANSLLVRGVFIDCEEPSGKCIVFPCYYLRIIFQEQNNARHAEIVKGSVMTGTVTDEKGKTELVQVKPLKEKTVNNHHVAVNVEDCEKT